MDANNANDLQKIDQILVYTSIREDGKINKNLSLSFNNVYGVKLNDYLYVYSKDKEYLGVIDTTCPHTLVIINWLS